MKKAGGKFSKKKRFRDFIKMRKLKKKPLAFSNLLKKPLLVQKQTIHQQKDLDFSFNLGP